MADNLTTTTTVSTVPNNTKIATREVTYSGDASSHIAPVGIVVFSGSDDAKTATDIPGDATNGLAVDVTRLPALPAGTNNIGDVDVLTLPAIPAGSNNIGDVDIASAPTGASAIQLQGTAAHDAAATGNPLQLGGVAETTRPTAVAVGDAVRAWFDQLGRQVVQIGSGEENYVAAEYTSNQTDASLIAAPGAGLYIRIFDILVSTGTTGTVLFEEGTSTRLFGRISLAASGGWSFNSAKGVRMATANTALTITTTTGAGPLSVTVNYSIEP